MSIVKGIVRKGEYFDSVMLMRLAQKLGELPGVLDSAAVMGSEGNKAILESAGIIIDEFKAACDNDLLIAFKTDNAEAANRGLGEIDKILSSLKSSAQKGSVGVPRTIEAALRMIPDANLAVISVAGRFAGDEAMRALESGLHVMLFSDNVSLEKEIELKRYAASHSLLVMGPDCGTAIINGIPLGFANAVNRGDIGIVAASGTGLQEVSCIISNAGSGISQAIGTGGRDTSVEVGGIMFIEAIKVLAENKATKILLLVSKPPAQETLKKIEAILENVSKPVVVAFLGATYHGTKSRIYFAKSLEDGALAAVALSKGEEIAQIDGKRENRDTKLCDIVKAEVSKLAKNQKYIRGIFSGGTFCYEAQVLLKDLKDVYSNSPIKGNNNLKDALKSEKNTLIDMGADEFTLGRLHPMIDFSLRKRRIIQEANDPETAVILLDIVLGYGANLEPLSEISPTIKEVKEVARKSGRHLPILCSVTGTDKDPQNRSLVVQGLKELGILVMGSNAAACKLASLIARDLS